MKRLVSVLLTYPNDERVNYQLFAEFLRLAGVYVCEDCRTRPAEKSGRWDGEDFSAQYTIERGQLGGMGTLQKLVRLQSVLNLQLGASDFDDCYLDIAKIYDNHSLLQASVTLQYFRTKTSKEDAAKEIIKQAGDSFECAADDFVALIKNKPEYMKNQYVRYAKLFCKQKANLAHYLCGEPVVYYVNDLGAEGEALLQRFPEFSNAWALLGFVYEISPSYTKGAIDAFQKAIRLEGEKPYVSSIYYWLGKRCEDYEYLKEYAYDFYKNAYFLMPKFRNIYKVANWHMQRKEWEEAILYYRSCLSFLEERGRYQDPLEQEYCFKVNVHICYCFMQQKDYAQAVNYAQKALKLREELENPEKGNPRRKFYYDMYQPEEAEKYINVELSRMRTRQANTYLAKAYQELHKPEQADYYLGKAMS